MKYKWVGKPLGICIDKEKKRGEKQKHIPNSHLNRMLECTRPCLVLMIYCKSKSKDVKDTGATELSEHFLGDAIARASMCAALHSHFFCKSIQKFCLHFERAK